MPGMNTPLSPDSILTVSELNLLVRHLIETGLPMITVEGEISNLARPASGHLYFSLKDSGAQVRCALFRNRAQLLRLRPADGQRVRARARPTLYENRGDFQLVVESLELAGEGALQQAFLALRDRLNREGLFDAERKKPLPPLPGRIGLITSPSGAALHDVLTVLARRFPLIPVLLYPSLVQGTEAAPQLCRALALAQERDECDVLLLVRGGGSLEDLWPFNDEALAREIAHSRLPIISGVGHEIDFTIADFVADARAPTPSAAAALATPDQAEFKRQIEDWLRRLTRRMETSLNTGMQRLDQLQGRLSRAHPLRRLSHARGALRQIEGRLPRQLNQQLDENRRHLSELQRRLAEALRQRITQHHAHLTRQHYRLERLSPIAGQQRDRPRLNERLARLQRAARQYLMLRQQRLDSLIGHLKGVNPDAVLTRGYAWVETQDGAVIGSADGLQENQAIRLRFKDGRWLCETREREII